MSDQTWARLQVYNPAQEKILEELHSKVMKDFGITLKGPYVTLRWYGPQGQMRSVTMLAIDIDSGVLTEGSRACHAGVCQFSEFDPGKSSCVHCGEPEERK